MMSPVHAGRSRLRVVGLLGAVGLLVALVAQSAQATPYGPSSATAATAATAHSCVVMAGSGDPAFVKNFNPYTATSLPSGDFVKGAFYEPLIISTSAGGGHQYPWLAQTWNWSNGNKTLTLNIRKGVKWSDGKPLTAADVVYSLTAGKQNAIMDIIGMFRPGTNIASVKQSGLYGVTINLKTPDSQFIAATLNGQMVVPQHIFSKVADITTWTNSTPVGSGPFTKITRFTPQDYVLSKNPNYWMAGAPKVPCLEYVLATSNDAGLLQIQSGQVDWTHNFVPNVESAYEAKDKAHFHAFYSTAAYAQSLTLDDTAYPYSLIAFRKALSLAIDRKSVSTLGEYGYAPPTDALGLSYLFPTWVTDPKVKALAKAEATYNPAAAKALLIANGFTYKGSQLIDPKGNPVTLNIHVISGWSDWVASIQIITKNLQAIGINSSPALEPDWNSWYPNAASTKTPTLLWQGASMASPYAFFFANMSQNAYIPPGQDATTTGNWEHYWNSIATKSLVNWKTTLNPVQQHKDATALENLWLQKLPTIPLFVGPRWSTYSTKYFHCFTSPKDYYGDPIFTTFPDNILSFTRICPGGSSGA